MSSAISSEMGKRLLDNISVKICCLTMSCCSNIFAAALVLSIIDRSKRFNFTSLFRDRLTWFNSQRELQDLETLKNVFSSNKYEDLTLIWYDTNMDDNVKHCLEQIHDNIVLCFNRMELIDSVDKILNHKILIIVSGQYSQDTLVTLHNNSKIDSFYIFCINDQLYQSLLFHKKYSKLIGIFTQYEKLFQAVKEQIRSILKHLSIFNLFDRNNKSLRCLDNEYVDYSWYQLMRDTLLTMNTHTDEAKQEMIDYCRSYYHSDMTSLKQIDKFSRSYQSCDAIKWYTKDCFLFRYVNKSLRTGNVEALYNLRYYIIDLCTNLRLLHDENNDTFKDIFGVTTKCYRGVNFSQNDIDHLTTLTGRHISTNGFLSTSIIRHLALEYSANVLFEIELNTHLKDTVYAYIRYLSEIPEEEEILFDLGTIFLVKNVKFENNICIVSMVTIPKDNDLPENEMFIQMRGHLDKCLNGNPLKTDILFGNFLLISNLETEAITYFEKLLKTKIDLNDYEKVNVFDSLANLYMEHNNELALKYALDAYDLHLTIQQFSFWTPYALNTIGDIYLQKKKFNIALDYFFQVLKIFTNNNQLEHIAYIHSDIATVYLCQDNFINAIEHYQQCIEILNKCYPSSVCYRDAETTFLGKLFYELGYYNDAIDHMKKYLQYNGKFRSKHHMDCATAYSMIGVIYFETRQYDLCIEYCEKALEVENNVLVKYWLYNYIGQSYGKLLQYEKAVDSYMKSLKISRSNDLICEESHACYFIALCHYEKDEYTLALEYYIKILVLYEKYFFNILLIEMHNTIKTTASLHVKLRQYYTGAKLLEKTINKVKLREINTKEKSIISCLNIAIGLLYQEAEEIDLALNYYKNGLSGLEGVDEIQNRLELITAAHIKIGKCYYKKEQYYEAIENFTLSLTFSQRNDAETVDLYELLGRCYWNIQKYDSALEFFEKAIEFHEANNIIEKIIDLYVEIGSLHVEKNDYDLAIQYLRKALTLEEKAGFNHTWKIINLFYQIGQCYRTNKIYDLSIEYFTGTLSLLQERANRDDVQSQISELHKEIGRCYYDNGCIEFAIEHYRKALEVQESLMPKNQTKHADLYLQLGQLFHSKGEYSDAIEYFQKSLSIVENTEPRRIDFVITLHENLGYSYDNMKNYVLTVKHFRKALDMQEQLDPNNKNRLIDFCNSIRECSLMIEQYDLALEYCIKTINIYRTCEECEEMGCGELLFYLGDIYYKKGNYEQAYENCVNSVAILEKNLTSDHMSKERMLKSYETLANICRHRGESKMALGYYKKLLHYLYTKKPIPLEDIKHIEELMYTYVT